jgi:hypothetical protein
MYGKLCGYVIKKYVHIADVYFSCSFHFIMAIFKGPSSYEIELSFSQVTTFQLFESLFICIYAGFEIITILILGSLPGGKSAGA